MGLFANFKWVYKRGGINPKIIGYSIVIRFYNGNYEKPSISPYYETDTRHFEKITWGWKEDENILIYSLPIIKNFTAEKVWHKMDMDKWESFIKEVFTESRINGFDRLIHFLETEFVWELPEIKFEEYEHI